MVSDLKGHRRLTRTVPSLEQVASRRPSRLGANLTSVTEVRESTRLLRFTQCVLGGAAPDASWSPPPAEGAAAAGSGTDELTTGPPGTEEVSSPGISSQTAAVRSKEQVANT